MIVDMDSDGITAGADSGLAYTMANMANAMLTAVAMFSHMSCGQNSHAFAVCLP